MGLRMLVVLLVAGGCATEDPQPLLVDLKTDFVPLREFATVETEVSRVDARGVRTSPALFELVVGGDEAFLDGVLVGDFEPPSGALEVSVTLLSRGGTRVAARRVRLPETRATAITVLVTRSCASVVCPDIGGAPSACVGGVCVDASCIPERPETCGSMECETDDVCTASLSECGRARCIDGFCFTYAEPTVCAAGSRCDLQRGCVPEDALECRDDADCVRDHATGRCTAASRCEIAACEAGFDDCDGLVDNGCEADLSAPATCGSCDNRCDMLANVETATCEMGACILTCTAGFRDCDDMVANGCEVNLALTCGGGCSPCGGGLTCCSAMCVNVNLSQSHCGRCGRMCATNESCAGGLCMRH